MALSTNDPQRPRRRRSRGGAGHGSSELSLGDGSGSRWRPTSGSSKPRSSAEVPSPLQVPSEHSGAASPFVRDNPQMLITVKWIAAARPAQHTEAGMEYGHQPIQLGQWRR